MKYKKPEMEVILLKTGDVIMTSPFDEEQNGSFGGEGDFSG